MKVFKTGQEALVQKYLTIIDCEAFVDKRPESVKLPPSTEELVCHDSAGPHIPKSKGKSNRESAAIPGAQWDPNEENVPPSITRKMPYTKPCGGAPQMVGVSRRVYNDIEESPDFPVEPESVPISSLPSAVSRSAKITKLVQDSARILSAGGTKIVRAPCIFLLSTVTAHVVAGDDVGALAVLRQFYPGNDLQPALRELVIMELARDLVQRDIDGKAVRPLLINRILSELTSPFDKSEVAKIEVFYQDIIPQFLPNNDKLVLNLEKSAARLNFGTWLYTWVEF